MPVAVVVDVPTVEAAASARTLATCNAALGPGQCALSDATLDLSGKPRWYAVVRYGPDGEARLSIELYEGSRHGRPIASSKLEFEERDSAEERWASVGVVVAALVLAQPATSERVEVKPAPEPLVARPLTASPRPPPSDRTPPWPRLDLGITMGSETRSAPLRVGPFGRFGIAFASIPAFAFASGAYTVRSAGSTVSNWLTGSLGAGLRVGFAQQRVALELRTELVLETIGIRATDGERSESARRTRWGPRLGLDLSGYWAKNWAVVLGAEAGALGPQVVIDSLGQTEVLPPFVWGVLSAVRYDFR